MLNTSKFSPERELYNQDGYIEAFGTWHPTGEKLVGVRWEREEGKLGFPNSFGKEQWLVISGDRTKSHLQGLLADGNSNKEELVAVLNEVYALQHNTSF
jgi:hypothetical protein